MAVELTPLGFRKPDGYELQNTFDDHVSHNAQKADDLLTLARKDINYLKTYGGDGSGPAPVESATSAEWAAANPILGEGMFGYDSTEKDVKLGDGLTVWNSLPYYSTLGDSQSEPVAANPLGSAENPVTDPAALRPTGMVSVWWCTAVKPTNWADNDFWMVQP